MDIHQTEGRAQLARIPGRDRHDHLRHRHCDGLERAVEADGFGHAYARFAAIRERFVTTAGNAAHLNSLAAVRRLETASRANYLRRLSRVATGLAPWTP